MRAGAKFILTITMLRTLLGYLCVFKVVLKSTSPFSAAFKVLYVCPAKLTSAQRFLIHQYAKGSGLTHRSVNKGRRRHLVISHVHGSSTSRLGSCNSRDSTVADVCDKIQCAVERLGKAKDSSITVEAPSHQALEGEAGGNAAMLAVASSSSSSLKEPKVLQPASSGGSAEEDGDAANGPIAPSVDLASLALTVRGV